MRNKLKGNIPKMYVYIPYTIEIDAVQKNVSVTFCWHGRKEEVGGGSGSWHWSLVTTVE